MSETLQILEKLNSLYSGAISQVITYTVGVLAFVGILIPVLIGLLQSRQLKNDHKSLSAAITAEMQAVKVNFQAEMTRLHDENELKLKKLIEDTTKEIKVEILKSENASEGRAMHLQANSNRVHYPASACSDALSAIALYAKSGSETNIAAIFGVFNETVASINESDVQEFDLEDQSKSAITALEKLNGNGRYLRDISSIRLGVSQAKVRKPQVKAEPSKA